MITEAQLDAMSEDERHTWLNSLRGDDYDIVHASLGSRYTIVMMSVAKNFLAGELPTDLRLKLLKFLDNRQFSVEAIAQLEPMGDEGFEIYKEAMKVGSKGVAVLGRLEVFSAFAALHPSLLAAVKMPRPQVYENTALGA
jgi:hypothetical protein